MNREHTNTTFRALPLCLLALMASSGCGESDADGFTEDNEFRALDDALELHWTFEDIDGDLVLDASGNGRHGTLNGGTLVEAGEGQAVRLDGVDDYISFVGPRDPALYGGVNGDFTLSARVRVDNPEKYNTLCWGCGPSSALYVGTANYGARVLAALWNQDTNGTLWPLSSPGLLADQWREITMVVEGGVAARYYFDCELDSELVNAGVGLRDYNYSAVGQGATPDRWYEGEIDELRVWSRALTDEDLAELCPAPPPLVKGLELHWTFEDHEGEQITDMSGKGRHGTLHGGSLVNVPFGEALSLDGVDDYVAFVGPRSPALYGGVDGDFTFSARVRVDDVDRYNTLCYGCGPFSTMYVGDPDEGGIVTASVGDQSNQGVLWSASESAVKHHKWAEVTMVVEGGVAVRHYSDCEFSGQRESLDIGLTDVGFSALGLGGVPDRWFGGEVDRLRIWSRALPEEELALLCRPDFCNEGFPGQGPGQGQDHPSCSEEPPGCDKGRGKGKGRCKD